MGLKKLRIPLAISIMIIILIVILVYPMIFGFSFISIVYAADAYGSDITHIEIYHHNGTAWVLVGNCTSSSGQSYSVHDTWPIKFLVNMKFNNTLASSTAEAISYTRVYMNITNGGSIWTDEELNNTACSEVGDFYELEEEGVWNATGYPVAGVTYECSVLYQGYY